MTASVKNALSAFRVLKDGLEELGVLRLLEVAKVAEKCTKSLADQVSFYEGEKSPLNSHGLAGLTLHHFTCPKTGKQHIVFTYPEGIEALEALTEKDSG